MKRRSPQSTTAEARMEAQYL